jgi:hypothetical protein
MINLRCAADFCRRITVRGVCRCSAVLLLAHCAACPPGLLAQTRRALLVGINKYQPPKTTAAAATGQVPGKADGTAKTASRGSSRELRDLLGSVNDVEMVKAILISRFGFEAENVHVLENRDATSEGIEKAFRKYIIEEPKSGDIALFYYAGHGSRMKNSKSDKPDKLDETIVPADSYKGVWDIRDKQISRWLNEALQKGVIVTMIADSCHSGSIARGFPQPGRSRDLPPDLRDANDPPDPGLKPEERGALILSAAQDTEEARERDDEKGGSHGAFSLALLQVLQSMPVNQSAMDTFLQVKAIMKAEGYSQEPVIAGPSRYKMPLLGSAAGNLNGHIRAAVVRVDDDGTITLQGGVAAGLALNSELRRVTQKETDPTVRLRVTEETGLNLSQATIIGEKDKAGPIRVGDLFELDRWVSPSGSNLRVWIRKSQIPYAELRKTAHELYKLHNSDRIEWISDPTQKSATHFVSWETEGWKFSTAAPGGQDKNLGAAPTAKAVLDNLSSGTGDKPKLFVDLPLPVEIEENLQLGEGTPNDAIEVTSREKAKYFLVGRVQESGIEYTWLLPNLTEETKGPDFPLPLRADWYSAGEDANSLRLAAGELRSSAVGIGKVHAWLELAGPPDDGHFPYKLALKKVGTGEKKSEGPLLGGEKYFPVLHATEEELDRWVDQRYVYVFTTDSFGKSQLLFPLYSSNVQNKFPNQRDAQNKWRTEIELAPDKAFTIGPPYGVDTYFLLTSDQPIPDPTVLTFEGVRTRGSANAGAQSPLEQLLGRVGSATRGATPPAPTSWSIQRISLRSAKAATAPTSTQKP